MGLDRPVLVRIGKLLGIAAGEFAMRWLMLAVSCLAANAAAQGKPIKTEVVGEYYCDPATMLWKTVRQDKQNPYRPVEGMCANQKGMTCRIFQTTYNDKPKTKTYKQVCR